MIQVPFSQNPLEDEEPLLIGIDFLFPTLSTLLRLVFTAYLKRGHKQVPPKFLPVIWGTRILKKLFKLLRNAQLAELAFFRAPLHSVPQGSRSWRSATGEGTTGKGESACPLG